jgi:putative transposase
MKTGRTPGEVRGFDGGKLFTGRKRHTLVDTLGLLLAVIVTSAAGQDRDGARLLGGIGKKLRLIWVDGAYRGHLLDWVAQRIPFRLVPIVPPKGKKGFTLLAKRWVVERIFAWLGIHRRLSRVTSVCPPVGKRAFTLP